MKARLVSLMFCFDNVSSSIFSVFFRSPNKFCVPECHKKGVKPSTAVRVFFSVSLSPLRGKQTKERSS